MVSKTLISQLDDLESRRESFSDLRDIDFKDHFNNGTNVFRRTATTARAK